MLGQSAGTALDVKKPARRVVQLAYEHALSALFYIKNSKNESLPSHRVFISVYVNPFTSI